MAFVAAIRKRDKGPRRRKKADVDDDEPPEWAKNCSCWYSFWSKTNIDEKFWSLQPLAQQYYALPKAQAFVAGLIMGNFVCNIIEKQIDPGSTIYTPQFTVLETFFNVAFLVELIVNLYAHWFWKFVKSPWNWFDALVVTLGMMSTLGLLEGPLTLLRNLRAFRVFRLFKRVKSLNKILQALIRAVPGTANAFLVLFLVMSIYAILAVEFFRLVGVNGNCRGSPGHVGPDEDGREVCEDADGNVVIDGNGSLAMVFGTSEVVSVTTVRGMAFGEEYFGNYGRALYTLFQVLLGDSWSEIVARTILWGYHPAMGTIFFVSFMIVNAVVLTNVALAVLIEKVIDDPDAHTEEEKDEDVSNHDSASPAGERKKKDEKKSKSSSPPAHDSTRVMPYDPADPLSPRLSPNLSATEARNGHTPTPAEIVSAAVPAIGQAPGNVLWHASGGADVSEVLEHVKQLREDMARVVPTLGELHAELVAMRNEQKQLLERLSSTQ